MRERDPDSVRETERNTTIIHTDGDRSGGSGMLVALVILVLLAVLLFFLFSGGFDRTADEGDINVNIETPDVTLPEVQLPDIDVPESDSGNSTNSS
ncbi:MAG: hypothetical protein H0X53_03275 [Sphingomonas sp.]|nr:hypothetical protein [Sphingomonas sp.]